MQAWFFVVHHSTKRDPLMFSKRFHFSGNWLGVGSRDTTDHFCSMDHELMTCISAIIYCFNWNSMYKCIYKCSCITSREWGIKTTFCQDFDDKYNKIKNKLDQITFFGKIMHKLQKQNEANRTKTFKCFFNNQLVSLKEI